MGMHKVAKYQKKAATQLKNANLLRKEQAKMSDPKNWKQYYESKAEAKKYSSYSKKRLKAYEDAGRKWLETSDTLNKMSWKDARAAKELYKITVDEVAKNMVIRFTFNNSKELTICLEKPLKEDTIKWEF